MTIAAACASMLFSTNSAMALSGLLCDRAMIRIAFQSSPILSLPAALGRSLRAVLAAVTDARPLVVSSAPLWPPGPRLAREARVVGPLSDLSGSEEPRLGMQWVDEDVELFEDDDRRDASEQRRLGSAPRRRPIERRLAHRLGVPADQGVRVHVARLFPRLHRHAELDQIAIERKI